ncbi:MAG TPA: septal ring lytic transglycosylase RlpA family protein [Rhodanobacteraceae bacterium]|jgi:rare lipoprotein A|nr:septal ring lytic transglycosylase RlpA family protein [Rhodanobacteraceae bacterium]
MTRGERALRALLALSALAVLTLAACSSNPKRPAARAGGGSSGAPWRDDTGLSQSARYRHRNDSTPDIAGIDFSRIPEPLPEALPLSRYGNKSPYAVNGETYRVLPSAAGYDERGIASYYGTKFNGYKTSNFETYDMYKFSAASKVLPLPSFARVTNLQNGKSVIVRINDRGPFVPNRIIDLSLAAAVRIGIWPRGTGLVEVQGIDPSHPNAEPAPVGAVTSRTGKPPQLYVQVGAFAEAGNAERLASRLRGLGLGTVRVVAASVNGRTLQRVQIGPLPDVDTVDRTTARLDALGLPHANVAIQ